MTIRWKFWACVPRFGQEPARAAAAQHLAAAVGAGGARGQRRVLGGRAAHVGADAARAAVPSPAPRHLGAGAHRWGLASTPGEISLAHHGVLFLDELPEFSRGAIESLRAPLEDRSVLVVRTAASVRFPARFSLVAAMNPCPCGHEGSSRRACVCDLPRIRAYRERLSGPMLDRFDLQLRVPPVELHTLGEVAEPSAPVRERVLRARAIQQRRAGQPNAELTGQALDEACALDERSRGLLSTIAEKRGLSARAIHRVLRVSRSAADLEGSPAIRTPHLAVALEMRAMDESHG